MAELPLPPIPKSVLQDLLSLVMEAPPSLSEIEDWTEGQKHEAEEWACIEHLEASDNVGLPKVRMPSFLKKESPND